MTFRSRILIACLIAAVGPLVLFALGARREVSERLSRQFEARVDASGAVIREDIERDAAAIDARLAALAARISDDAALRAALMRGLDAGALRDYAAEVMPATGLDYLLLVDGADRVLSSGHYRNDYGRQTSLRAALPGSDGPVLVATRRPDERFLALARAHAFSLGVREFMLVGGIEIDSAFVRMLARDAGTTLVVSLAYPGGELRSDASSDDGDVARQSPSAANRDVALQPIAADDDPRETIELPFIDEAAAAVPGRAVWTIRHSLAPLHAVQRGMDRWLIVAVVAAIILAWFLARLSAARANRPLEELAQRSRRIDLDRVDVSFATGRYDEIGSLSRVLDVMVKRLRARAADLRRTERRATIGDMARQVNHDIRNGLLPIRNVIRHLGEVARDRPAELATVFNERAGTLQSGMGYLENLATNYARLSPGSDRRVCDVNVAIRDALSANDTSGAADASAATDGSGAPRRSPIRLQLASSALPVIADPVALRRVIENLVVNATDSLANGDGSVLVRTGTETRGGQRRVAITIADTGGGIAPDALERIFDDFYTTKRQGSGLGLSIVRRLVTDMGGRIGVESRVGEGTSFRIDLPEAG